MSTSKPTSPWKSNDEPDAKSEKPADREFGVVNDLVDKICRDFINQAETLGRLGVEGGYPTALMILAVAKLHSVNMRLLRNAEVPDDFRKAYLASLRVSDSL